jgi:histone deacetylase complex regulatory component SIN3
MQLSIQYIYNVYLFVTFLSLLHMYSKSLFDFKIFENGQFQLMKKDQHLLVNGTENN